MFGYSLIRTKKLEAIYDKMAILAIEKIRNQNKFNMTISGTISVALPEQSGTSKSGKTWRKREYVCVYDNSNANYPKSVVFQVMNDNIEKLNIQQGIEYDLELDFEAREWNGRYFLQASCWKATAKSQPAPQPVPQAQYASVPEPAQQSDDLPF